MKKFVSKSLITVGCLGLMLTCVACGPGLMMPTQTVNDTKADKALITFVRATRFGGRSEFHIWDSKDYVGTIEGGQYVQKEVDAGEHMFIAHGQNWAYIKADLEAGKKYYILLNVTIGFTHATVIPVPLTKSHDRYTQDDINNWMTSLRPVTPHPEGSKEFVEARKEQVQRAVENGQKPGAEFQTLAAEDFWD